MGKHVLLALSFFILQRAVNLPHNISDFVDPALVVLVTYPTTIFCF